MTKEEAAETFGGEEADPQTKARAEELLEDALAAHHLDWETERDRAARAEERRLPPELLRAVLRRRHRLRRREGHQAARPWHLAGRPLPGHAGRPQPQPRQARRAGSRPSTSGSPSTSPSPPARVAARKSAALPPPSCAAPGHPLFDALVRYVDHARPEATSKGAVLFDPDIEQPAVLRFLSATSSTATARSSAAPSPPPASTSMAASSSRAPRRCSTSSRASTTGISRRRLPDVAPGATRTS